MIKPAVEHFQCKRLDDLIAEFVRSGVEVGRMTEADIEVVKKICNQKDCIIWVHNFVKIGPYFINDVGKEYFGFESNDLSKKGPDFFAEFVHPQDLIQIHKTIGFYTDHPNGTNRLTYRGKHHTGHMRWLYSFDRVLNFTEAGLPHYFVAMSFDIENMTSQFGSGATNFENTQDKRNRYNDLTKREREILYLIAHEYTSSEIAAKLFIETSTVSTHRKHIVTKLKVKSSIGLVEYSLLFSSNTY